METSKKISRVLLSLIIVLGISVTSIGSLVYANQTITKTTKGSVSLFENTTPKESNHISNFSKVNTTLKVSKSEVGVTYNVTTIKEFEAKVNYAISNRASQVNINYTGSKSVGNSIDFMQSNVLTAVKTAGNDYEKNLLSSYGYSITDLGANEFDVTYTFEYLETQNQEDQVKAKVKDVLGQIVTSNMTDSQKVKVINSYICRKLTYDTTLTNYSAYDGLLGNGKTVCQGYALLAYRMLTDAGLQARIITGTAHNGNDSGSHAWNMVMVSGSWYHLDTTWNDPIPDVSDRVMETYLLRSDAEMSLDHNWDKTLFPVATNKYNVSTDTSVPIILSVPILSVSQITVVNNAVNYDYVKVNGLIKGDVIKVYASDGKTLLGWSNAIVSMSKDGSVNTEIEPYVNIKLKAQLSETVREIKVTVTNSNAITSLPVSKTYAATQKSVILNSRYMSTLDGKVCVKRLLVGDIVNVYSVNPALTKGAKPISKATVSKGYSYLFAAFKTTASKIYVTRTSENKLESVAIMIKSK